MNIEQWQSWFLNKVDNIDLRPVIADIREVVRNSIDRNFSEGGRYGNDNPFGGGSEKWIKSKRAIKQSGQTLVDTSHLRKSIQVKVSMTERGLNISVQSNLDYAAIHQFGGIITRPPREQVLHFKEYKKGKKKGKTQFAKSSKATYGQKVSVGAVTVRIEKRPFLVLQDEDLEQIEEILINQIVNNFSK